MAGDLLIRTVEQADLPALLELYRDLNPSDPPLALADATSIWRQISNYAGCTIFVGVREKSLVTSCTLVVVPNLTRGGLPYGLIENVVTSSKHRKQGYGAAVLKHAFAEAWKHWLLQDHAFDRIENAGDAEILRGRGIRAEQDRIPDPPAA